jgi:hypothetical protein
MESKVKQVKEFLDENSEGLNADVRESLQSLAIEELGRGVPVDRVTSLLLRRIGTFRRELVLSKRPAEVTIAELNNMRFNLPGGWYRTLCQDDSKQVVHKAIDEAIVALGIDGAALHEFLSEFEELAAKAAEFATLRDNELGTDKLELRSEMQAMDSRMFDLLKRIYVKVREYHPELTHADVTR